MRDEEDKKKTALKQDTYTLTHTQRKSQKK